MNGETTVPDNGRENEKSPVTNTIISNALKGLTEVKTAKINIEKVFVLNEKCFVKGIKPASSNIIQLQNTKSIPPKKDESTNEKKCSENINQQLIEIKSNDVKSALQLSGTNAKKIIITGSKAISDMETLQKIINQLANSKNKDQIKIDDTTKKIIIQNYEVKTSLGEEKNAIHIEPAKPIVQDQVKNTINVISDKANNSGKNHVLEKAKDTTTEKNRPPEVHQLDTDSSPEPQRKVSKQKRFLYRLKSKNGRVLTYTSDVSIKLKKPQINVTKMTQADAERLSKQFAEETRKKMEEANKRISETKNDKKSTVGQPRTSTADIPHPEDNASPSYGIQTRKRQLKFLSDGRIIKDKKLKRESFSSTSMSSSDDEKVSSSTSDEDYNELNDLDDINKKTTTSKKISPVKKTGTNNKSLPATKGNKSEIPLRKPVPASLPVREKKTVVPVTDKNATVCAQDKKTIVCVQDEKSTTEPSKRPIIDPAQLLSSLLGVQISSDQLKVTRFKPKYLKEKVNNNTIVSKKVFIPSSSHPMSKNSSVTITTKFVASEPPPLSPICKPGLPSNRINTSVPIKSVPPKSKNDSLQNKSKQASVEFARNNSFSYKTNPAPLQPIRNNSLDNSPKLSPSLDWPQDLATTFKDFTDSRVVKTKAGPKKLLVDKLNESENPRTVYDIMSDIFDLMPSWNLHVLPENKSFCLAQVTRSRMGVPVLKKCIEINSDFLAKVYVHQLHCKRYDGIYDTEGKLRKLIKDIDHLVV